MESKYNNNIGVGYGNVNTKPKENNQDSEEKLVQYNLDGKYIETWNTLKEFIQQCVSDDINIIDALNAENIKDKQMNDSYFFWEKDLIKHFNAVPIKIKNLPQTPKEKPLHSDNVIRKQLPQTPKEKYVEPDVIRKQYTVIEYDDNGNVINNYENVYEAGYRLRLTKKTIADICRGGGKYIPYNLKYGEKKKQALEKNYPEYTPQTLCNLKANIRSISNSM